MADAGIKNVTILNEDLPIINAKISGYAVRYRIVSEDKNRVSHWSPVHYINAGYYYIAGQSPEIINNQNSLSVIWDNVRVKKGESLIGTIRDYEVWVRWGKASEGDWVYQGKSSANNFSAIYPETYFYNGIDQEEKPDQFSIEIYLEGSPVSRDNQSLLMYSVLETTI
jgi:hypothetical protein